MQRAMSLQQRIIDRFYLSQLLCKPCELLPTIQAPDKNLNQHQRFMTTLNPQRSVLLRELSVRDHPCDRAKVQAVIIGPGIVDIGRLGIDLEALSQLFLFPLGILFPCLMQSQRDGLILFGLTVELPDHHIVRP